MSAERISAGHIKQAMLKSWADPQYAVLFEVGNSTGGAASRYADAIIAPLWPSLGLGLHGVEIKVSRSDYRREAADPTKCEAIARFCSHWWIHTPPGLIKDIAELPEAWGLREWNGKTWRTVKKAERRECEPPTPGFLASLLRRNDGAMRQAATSALAQERAEMERTVNERVEREIEYRTQTHRRLAERVKAFEESSGLSIGRGYEGAEHWGEVAKTAKALIDAGLVGKSRLGILSTLQSANQQIEAVVSSLQTLNQEREAAE